MLKLKEVKNKDLWEDFLSECEEKTFLQSWNWGEFQIRMGNKIWRFGVYENNHLVTVSLIFKIEARRGSFLFLPHGPIIKQQVKSKKRQVLKTLLKELKKIAKKERIEFIRVSPIWKRSKENMEIFRELGFRDAPIHMHPELTWQLDITPSEKDILMGMRKTTRYLIRKARKNRDVQIIKSQTLKDLKTFNQLYRKTAERHQFIPFSWKYLKSELLSFKEDNQDLIFLGKYKEEVVSGGVFIFWSKIGFYHQGASLLKYPKIPDSYLLQWEAIKEAKKRGCKIYNFWGIAPVDKKSHPWAGLTLFKKGFGGRKAEYIKTQDLPLSKTYWLTFFFEKIRKMKRGL